MLMGGFIACQSRQSSNNHIEEGSGEQPAEIKIFARDSGRVVRSEHPVVQEIEKKTNTKLEVVLVPSNEILQNYSIVVASGEIPDISMLDQFDYFQFVGQGIYRPLDDLLQQNGENIKK